MTSSTDWSGMRLLRMRNTIKLRHANMFVLLIFFVAKLEPCMDGMGIGHDYDYVY